MFNRSDSWLCSIADGLKDITMPYTVGVAGVSSLQKCQNALLVLSDLHNIMNEDVHVALCQEEECAG